MVHDITTAFCTRCGELNCERHGSSFQNSGEGVASISAGPPDGEPFKDFDAHARRWTTPCGPACYKLSASAAAPLKSPESVLCITLAACECFLVLVTLPVRMGVFHAVVVFCAMAQQAPFSWNRKLECASLFGDMRSVCRLVSCGSADTGDVGG